LRATNVVTSKKQKNLFVSIRENQPMLFHANLLLQMISKVINMFSICVEVLQNGLLFIFK